MFVLYDFHKRRSVNYMTVYHKKDCQTVCKYFVKFWYWKQKWLNPQNGKCISILTLFTFIFISHTYVRFFYMLCVVLVRFFFLLPIIVPHINSVTLVYSCMYHIWTKQFYIKLNTAMDYNTVKYLLIDK